jgi:hypothetical protein
LFNASGTINGPVTVNGTLAPGNNVGTLYTGAESWNSGGTYKFAINDATGTAGVDPGWGLLNITDALTVNATSGSKFTIKVVSLSGSSAGSAANFNNTLNYTWRIATASGGVSGFVADKFTIDDSLFTNAKGSGHFIVAQSGNNVYLEFGHVTADPVTIGRAWGTFLRIPVADVMAHTSGGTGTRTLQSVTSRDGDFVQISGDGSEILFAPTGNATRILDYMVVDSTSPTPYTGSSTITVNVTIAVSAVNAISSTGGGVTITFAGIPGYHYVVERSGFSSDWSSATPVQTIQAPDGGVWTFTDPTPPDTTLPPNPSFYRLRQNN